MDKNMKQIEDDVKGKGNFVEIWISNGKTEIDYHILMGSETESLDGVIERVKKLKSELMKS